MSTSETALALIIIGGALQITGVAGVIVEVHRIRARVNSYRNRPISLKAVVRELTAISDVVRPVISAGAPTVEQRIERLEQRVDAIATENQSFLEGHLREVRRDIDIGDYRVLEQTRDELDELAALVVDLQPVDRTSNLLAVVSSAAIFAGVAITTVGSALTL